MIDRIHFLNNRSLWAYYLIFFSGSAALLYQASGWSLLGDSVNFLCLLFFLTGFFTKRPSHIVENSFLMTVGYILPLLIRNSLKLSSVNAPAITDFLKLALISTLTTLALGIFFTSISYLFRLIAVKISQMSRSKIATGTLYEPWHPNSESTILEERKN